MGFGLSLLAAAASSLAGGATLILCEEPDGCVQIEFVAKGVASSTACGGHEHEASPETAAGPLGMTSHPCEDTVIASLGDTVRPDKGFSLPSKSRDVVIVEMPAVRTFGARECVAIENVPARDDSVRLRVRLRQPSVVLRN